MRLNEMEEKHFSLVVKHIFDLLPLLIATAHASIVRAHVKLAEV